jgi:hypothetical protein
MESLSLLADRCESVRVDNCNHCSGYKPLLVIAVGNCGCFQKSIGSKLLFDLGALYRIINLDAVELISNR